MHSAEPATDPTPPTVGAANSPFHQPWWLEAVAPGRWSAVEVKRDGVVTARLPYVIRRRYGLTLLTMPPLTPVLGPWLAPTSGKYETALTEQHHLLTALVEGLPSFDLFTHHFHPSVTNWLPFYWKGFTQTTRYTYRLERAQDLDAVWSALRDKTRNAIRKAERDGIVVEESEDIDTFIGLYAKSFARQGLALPCAPELIRRIDAASRRQNARKLYLARGRDGTPHAGVFCVHDDTACYYLMQGGDPALRDSGANLLAVWRSIELAGKRGLAYDFEGSVHRPIERFVRSFGAVQTPYLQVRGVSRRMRVLLAGRELLRALVGR